MTQPVPVSSRWPQSLTLYNLERIGGFEIVWTDHLADHLFLDEDLGTIKVYHHAYVLQCHQSGNLAKYVYPHILYLMLASYYIFVSVKEPRFHINYSVPSLLIAS